MLKRYSKVSAKLPIELVIRTPGVETTHQLNEGDEVTCRYCGKKIVLGSGTVFKYRHKFDKNPKVWCMECGHAVDAVYYATDKNRVRIVTWDQDMMKKWDPDLEKTI